MRAIMAFAIYCFSIQVPAQPPAPPVGKVWILNPEMSDEFDAGSPGKIWKVYDKADSWDRTAAWDNRVPEIQRVLENGKENYILAMNPMWYSDEDIFSKNGRTYSFPGGGMNTKAATSNSGTDSMSENRVQLFLDATTKRSIGGISELNRLKYFNICDDGLHFYDHVPSKEAGDYLIDSLHVNFGRMIGLARQVAQKVREDPGRPGYADPESVKEAAEAIRKSDALKEKVPNLDVIEHGSPLGWPRFMMPEGRLTKTSLPVNMEAAAEFMALAFKESLEDWNRPKYIELVNEYAFPEATNEEMDYFCEMHNELARAFRKVLPGTMVGGPCYWYGNFHENNFTDWDYTMKRYMDIAHQETSFYSFHNYDFSNGGKRNIATGTRTEAILDLVENYSLVAHGEIKPFASSECGATGVDHWWYFSENKNLIDVEGSDTVQRVKVISYPELAWQHMRALNGQIMSYINRPDRILKVVPFTLVDASIWTPRAHWTLFRREDFKKDGKLVPTHHMKFYEFWKDVKGERVSLQSSNPDIQVQAFLDHNQVFVCLNNLSELDHRLNLKTFFGEGVAVERVNMRSFYFDGEVPVLEDQVIDMNDVSFLPIKGDESMILTFQLDQSPAIVKKISEHFHYGNRTVVPISGATEEFLVEVPSGNIEYATLRIGISRRNKLAVVPLVTLNGQKLEYDLEQSYDKQITHAQKEYAWGIRSIPVPVQLLKEMNKVEVTFNDEGGVISSVIIKTHKVLK